MTSHARRRLIALLLARGEIGPLPDSDSAPERDDAAPAQADAAERDAQAPPRFERDESTGRAA